MTSKKSAKTILEYIVATDIHYSLENVDRLREWVKHERSKQQLLNLEGIISCGDLVNADHEAGQASDASVDKTQLKEVLAALRSIGPKLWFIPGNHDPAYLFEEQAATDLSGADAQESKENFHLKKIELAPGLVLAGLGGSVDSTLCDSPAKVFWKGYPYNEHELEEKLRQLLASLVQSQDTLKADQILLVTHTGPAYTGTTDILYPSNDFINGSRVQSGSVAMASYLKEFSQLAPPNSPHPILAHIHGHSHPGRGASNQIPYHPTINPGPLKYGQFLHFTLAKESQGRWKLGEMRFVDLSTTGYTATGTIVGQDEEWEARHDRIETGVTTLSHLPLTLT